ncbi:Lnb N-terminal periplasmic domain-containing protein [Chelatococcus reniformis]|nr:DUF4105 domain-containing protein [Chelatococcus reniformis]
MTRRGARGAAIGILALAILGFGVWGTLAVWFRSPLGPALQAPAAVAWALLSLAALAVLLLSSRRWTAVAIYALAIAALLGWWSTIHPSNHRDWAVDVSRPATGEITGNRLVVRNVRNFDWRTEADMTPRWEERSYDLDKLVSVDLYADYWAGEAIAHTIVSFGFADGTYLAWSIELRRRQKQAFSALAGFFKESELIYIAADERDAIRLRTNIRHEDLRLYRLKVPAATARGFLEAYVAEANALAAKPVWYNTLTSNCTTLVFRMAKLVEPGIPFDWRVLLSGYFPAYAYDRGALDTSLPFAELARRSRISQRAIEADDAPQPLFSELLRVDIPGIAPCERCVAGGS